MVGIALPAAAAWRWRDDKVARDVLVAYAGLTVAQIGLEQIGLEVALVGGFFPATAVLSGLTFTSLRLLQLGLALSARDAAGTHLPRPPLVRGLLWAGVALWAANAVFLASTVMVTPPRP